MPDAVSEINFFDEETHDCPYPAYQALRDERPSGRTRLRVCGH